jgi:hypothetical protein
VLVHANKGMNMLVLEHVPVRMVFYFFFYFLISFCL